MCPASSLRWTSSHPAAEHSWCLSLSLALKWFVWNIYCCFVDLLWQFWVCALYLLSTRGPRAAPHKHKMTLGLFYLHWQTNATLIGSSRKKNQILTCDFLHSNKKHFSQPQQLIFRMKSYLFNNTKLLTIEKTEKRGEYSSPIKISSVGCLNIQFYIKDLQQGVRDP